MCVCVCLWVFMGVCVMCMHKCACVFMCAFMWVCICLHVWMDACGVCMCESLNRRVSW